jgi:acetyl esterase/lipase
VPSETIPQVPFDPELLPFVESLNTRLPSVYTADFVHAARSGASYPQPPKDELEARGILTFEHSIAGHGGDILLTRYSRADHRPGTPAVYWIHGGGFVIGNRFTGIEVPLEWVEQWNFILVTVEYRLAPDFPYPAAFDDCYAGLEWFADRYDDFGFDPQRLLVSGASAGGGLAAAMTLAARDRNGPRIKAQLLMYPMLDDRNVTTSSLQYGSGGSWNRESNNFGWLSYLGDSKGEDDVSYLASPGRVSDCVGLPSTYLDSGSAEVFRDEIVAYAGKLWASGIQAELHVWAGGFHGWEGFAPQAALSVKARDVRNDWIRRTLRVG